LVLYSDMVCGRPEEEEEDEEVDEEEDEEEVSPT
jgi:hypothetical protein